MKIVLFDYEVGNLHSLGKALEAGGATVRVEADPAAALDGDALVLPGVGAFAPAARRIAPAGGAIRAALDDGFPCLGVCLGMQLLFEGSEEGDGRGLGIVRGSIRRVEADRVPHMGWNAVRPSGPVDDPVLAGIGAHDVYYANSYVAEPNDPGAVVAWTAYDADRFPAAVRRRRTWGIQFHPEKSGAPGLRLIRNFIQEAVR